VSSGSQQEDESAHVLTT